METDKIRLMCTLVTSIFLYTCESWTLTAELKEEYKSWKWGATARYYAYHLKTMLPSRKSVPRSSRQSYRRTRQTPGQRKETQTEVVWTCLPSNRFGQNRVARHSERGKKTKQTEDAMGRQHQGMDRPGVRQVPEDGREQGKMEETVRNHLWCSNDPRG